MTNGADPASEQWNHYPKNSEKFPVGVIHDLTQTLETRYLGGAIDVFELVRWYAMETGIIATPEDRTAPLDVFELDDLILPASSMRREYWVAPSGEGMEKTSAGAQIVERNRRLNR